LYFTHNGAQHFIRILSVDTKPGEIVVYEGLVNGREYFHFEFKPDTADIWELFEHAVSAYREYTRDSGTTTINWRSE